MDSISLLGLRVNRLSMEEALQALERFIRDRAPQHVVTADASMAVIARRDPELHAIVQEADLVTPDGFGIVWASRLLRMPIAHKVSGVDLVAQLCRLSAQHGYRLFFLGAAPGVAALAADNLCCQYPGAQIVGTRDGYFSADQEPEIIAQIKAARPDALLVAFGIPKQEKWINKYKEELAVPVSVGIGGSFDVYSGRVKRAPTWMQNQGMEWLYRLWCNPRKIAKVMTLPKFVLLVWLLVLRRRFLGAAVNTG